MRKTNKWSDDAAVLAEGRKYSNRTEFMRGSSRAYCAARMRNLLDQLYPSRHADWSDDAAVLAEGRKYSNRTEFSRKNGSAYAVAHQRNLLDQLYPSFWRNWSDDADILAEGHKYASRNEFCLGSSGAYRVAKERNLLDQLYPSLRGEWSNDKLLAEGRKHASRLEFQRSSPGAYTLARKRKLLDLINWPEENARSDNDAIYIWRAMGRFYNGNAVYKIGVTSARLGVVRVKQVADKAGFDFELICCEPVYGKASELERKLHILGESPGYAGFDGCTEFRALSDSALYAAITLICEVVKP